MDSPTLATTQATMILSAHEAANGRDSRAWIYSGMAVQMATDLGLHLNMEMDGKYQDVVTEIKQVIALRNNIFWVVYTSNTYVYLSACQLNLPSDSSLQCAAANIKALQCTLRLLSGLHSDFSQVPQHIQWSSRSYVQIQLYNTNFASSSII